MSSQNAGPSVLTDITSHHPLARVAVDIESEAQVWEPVPAFRSRQQDRLSTELVGVLHAWVTRMRPGLWRNPLGEPYPK